MFFFGVFVSLQRRARALISPPAPCSVSEAELLIGLDLHAAQLCQVLQRLAEWLVIQEPVSHQVQRYLLQVRQSLEAFSQRLDILDFVFPRRFVD